MSAVPPSEPLPPPDAATATATEIAYGLPIHPVDRLRILSDNHWEQFVVEWADGRTAEYVKVERLGGAGDGGRDVLGFRADGSYDLFQCKHCDHPIQPGEIWVELGKLLWGIQTGKFDAPHAYYFVAPCGVGTKLSNLLRDPDALRDQLMAAWAKSCENDITRTQSVPLTGPLLDFVQSFDYSIFGSKPPHVLIDEHATTRWHAFRFGGGLPARPTVADPPEEVALTESRYVRALLDAYGDHLGESVADPDGLPPHQTLRKHFTRSRNATSITPKHSAPSLEIQRRPVASSPSNARSTTAS